MEANSTQDQIPDSPQRRPTRRSLVPHFLLPAERTIEWNFNISLTRSRQDGSHVAERTQERSTTSGRETRTNDQRRRPAHSLIGIGWLKRRPQMTKREMCPRDAKIPKAVRISSPNLKRGAFIHNSLFLSLVSFCLFGINMNVKWRFCRKIKFLLVSSTRTTISSLPVIPSILSFYVSAPI